MPLGFTFQTLSRTGVAKVCSDLTWTLDRTAHGQLKGSCSVTTLESKGLGCEFVVCILATLPSWTLDKNDVNKNTVLCISYIWQFVELRKAVLSRGLNTKSGQLARNSLVSNYSQQGARRKVRLGNLTVI